MKKKQKMIVSLLLTVIMVFGLFGGMSTTVSAAIGIATIDISTLGVMDTNNSASAATESQWNYISTSTYLGLNTENGNYTLTGTNSDLNAWVTAANVKVTLNGVSITHCRTDNYPALGGNDRADGLAVNLVGDNILVEKGTASGVGSFFVQESMNSIITSTSGGTMKAMGDGSGSGIYLAANSTMRITGNAVVTAVGGAAGSGLNCQTGSSILIGDNAKLIITNNSASEETRTFTKADVGTTHKWKLTNTTLTSGALTDADITVTVAAGNTATIEREPIPASTGLVTINISELDGEHLTNKGNLLGESEWGYWNFGATPSMSLLTKYGNYKLIGANTLAVNIDGGNANVTLDNVNITSPGANAFGSYAGDDIVTLVGNNAATSGNHNFGLAKSGDSLTITSTVGGRLAIKGGPDCFCGLYLLNAVLNITGNAAITTEGGTATVGLYTVTGGVVLIGDNASLTIKNNSPDDETHTVGKAADATALYKWKLTGAVTNDDLKGDEIEITIPAGETGTIERESGIITPPTITTATILSGTVGTAYSQTLTATGNPAPTWSIDNGALPNGLTLNPATGVIFGNPTSSGTFSFTVKATNNAGSGTKALSIVISAAPSASPTPTDTGTSSTATPTPTGTGSGTASSAPTPEVLSVEMPQKNLYIVKGKSVKIPAIAYTKFGEKVALLWKSNETSIATVTQKGDVKGVKPGSTSVTATAPNGKKATLKVFVIKKAKKVKKITVAKKSMSAMKIGKSKFLIATLKPKNATGKTGAVYKWSSKNKKIAKIDAAGKITALKKGKSKITVTVGGKKKSFTLTIK